MVRDDSQGYLRALISLVYSLEHYLHDTIDVDPQEAHTLLDAMRKLIYRVDVDYLDWSKT